MIYQRRFGMRSASKYAWMAPAVVALALLLVFLFGNDKTLPSPSFAVIEDSQLSQVIRLGEDGVSTSPSYVPPSSDIRKATLQNLSEFRATYKIVGPGITIVSTGKNPANNRLVNTLEGMLAHYNLSKDRVPETIPDSEYALTVYARKSDVVMTHKLLKAISPMVRGKVGVIFDNELAAGQLLVLISAPAQYSDDGAAYF